MPVQFPAALARWRWRGERRREAGSGSLSLGVCFQRAPVPDSRLSAPWPTWRTLKTLFNGPLVFSGPTPRSQISHSHTGLQRMRLRRAKRRGGREGGSENHSLTFCRARLFKNMSFAWIWLMWGKGRQTSKVYTKTLVLKRLRLYCQLSAFLLNASCSLYNSTRQKQVT